MRQLAVIGLTTDKSSNGVRGLGVSALEYVVCEIGRVLKLDVWEWRELILPETIALLGVELGLGNICWGNW